MCFCSAVSGVGSLRLSGAAGIVMVKGTKQMKRVNLCCRNVSSNAVECGLLFVNFPGLLGYWVSLLFLFVEIGYSQPEMAPSETV